MRRFHLAAATAAVLLATGPAWTPTARAQGVVTVYSADGLHDGSPNWYQTEFDAFTKQTGIKVQYIEGGSGVVVDRVEKERGNPQADVLVTLPPFIQKAAANGDLAPYTPAGADQIPAANKDPEGRYIAMINNYMNFIYDAKAPGRAPGSFTDLLEPRFKNKIQYSTPGQAGDGTAVMIEVIHAFGSPAAGFDYLEKLQANNLGPSSSTGKLTAMVNKGEIYVANGDMQMNLAQMPGNPNIRIFFPKGPDGQRSTFALPYYIALVHGAPHPQNGKKLIDFLLSRPAQETVSSIAQGMPVRSDVHPTDQSYKEMQAKLQGVKVWSPDWAAVAATMSKDVARWHSATGS